MILHIQQGLKENGFTVPMTKLCRWFDVPRRTVYYKPVKSTPKVQERFAEPIKPHDRGRTRVWLSNRGEPVAVQQEHGTADLPAQRLAGSQASHWASTPHRGAALGRNDAE